jgi:hypothetical protein
MKCDFMHQFLFQENNMKARYSKLCMQWVCTNVDVPISLLYSFYRKHDQKWRHYGKEKAWFHACRTSDRCCDY